MKSYIRWANVLFLTVLLANLVAPPGTVHRALADDPPPPPTEGPLAGNFPASALASVHETLFGPASEGDHTIFYPTTSVIKGVAKYTAVNNVGQPVVLDVIRHFHYTDTEFSTAITDERLQEIAQSQFQRGLLWVRMSTQLGFVNVLAVSFASPETSTTTAVQAIVPILNHDALMEFYNPGSGFKFFMMAESWNPNAENGFEEPDWNTPPDQWTWPLPSPNNDGEACGIYLCSNGGSINWCANQDAAVQLARAQLKICLDSAAERAAILLAIAVATLAAGLIWCNLAWFCSIGVLLLFAIAAAGIVATYNSDVNACWANYWLAFNAALAAACDEL